MKPAEHKIALRRELRAVRARIAADPAERSRRSAEMWDTLRETLDPLSDANGRHAAPLRVMMFESLPGEPDTASWGADLSARGAEVFVPEVDGPHVRVMPGDLEPELLDAVIVPGVAFTADGRRLGQGGGHYDRFLRRLRADCLTLGVCFREQLLASLPTEPHDRRVTAVVWA